MLNSSPLVPAPLCLAATILDDLAAGEPPMVFTEAARLSCLRRHGRAPHVGALYRWASTGVDGVRLEWAKVGGIRVTTRAAVLRFISRLTDGGPTPAPTDLPRDVQRRHQEAGAALAAAGI